GMGGWISPETKAGVFLGASSGTLSVKSSQSIDWQSWFGGLYAGRSLGERSQAGLTLLGGVTSYNSSRDVVDNTVASGFTVAKADYTGAFLSPELSLSCD